jgi:hypothetical protein
MGILSWLFGRRSPAITFTSFSTPVSPAATDTSHSKSDNVGPITAPAVPLAPETPWPKWKNGQPYSVRDKEWRDLQREGMKHAKAGCWASYSLTHSDKAYFVRNEGNAKRALELFLESIYLELNGPQNGALPWEKQIPLWQPSAAKVAPCYVEAAWGEAEKCEMDLEGVGLLFLKVTARQYQSLRLPVPPEEAWQEVREALDAYISQSQAEKAAKLATKEARRLERQAERDARRAEKEAAKALEREQNKAAQMAQRIAKKAEQVAIKADGPQDE